MIYGAFASGLAGLQSNFLNQKGTFGVIIGRGWITQAKQASGWSSKTPKGNKSLKGYQHIQCFGCIFQLFI